MMVQGRKVETKLHMMKILFLKIPKMKLLKSLKSIKPNLKGKQIWQKVAPHITMVKNEYVVEKGNEGSVF
jgi:hypothetical protein